MGRAHTPETREKLRQAALRRERKPRAKRSNTKAAGGQFARRWFTMPDLCERCQAAKPVDRHHKDADPQNNAPENIAFLCRRCHQAVDGRVDILRENGKARASATHCANGHARSPENTYYTKTGRAHCRLCNRDAVKRYRARLAQLRLEFV